MDFVPLVTDDYKLAFCQATNALPELAQYKIWSLVWEPSPSRKRVLSPWVQRLVKKHVSK